MSVLTILAIILGTPVAWLLLMMARWSAPLSLSAGFLIMLGGLHLESFRAVAFGGGLCAVSMLLLALSGVFRGLW